MKESSRALTRGQLRAAVVAPNLEKSEGAGGLDEEVGTLIEVRRFPSAGSQQVLLDSS